MRIKNTLRNSVVSILTYGVVLLLGMVVRRVFVHTLDISYLGYEGLFSNLFSIFSLAELGTYGIITYQLYDAQAKRDIEEICCLMSMFKVFYRFIALFIGTVGILFFFFLPVIVKEQNTNWLYVRLIYFVQLGIVLCNYFLAYRRILFITTQQEYLVAAYDSLATVICSLLKIVVLFVLHSYILYLFLSILQNIAANLLIAWRYKRKFPQIREITITAKMFQERHFFHDIWNVFWQKIGGTIYGGVDNIVISAILGIRTVGLYSNYIMVGSTVVNVLYKFFWPVRATIGDLVRDSERQKGIDFFYGFDLFFFFLASCVFTCFVVLYQPFITLWLGEAYLLPLPFVFFYSMIHYYGVKNQCVCYFRDVFGEYQLDKVHWLLSAASNLGLSILLAPHFGLAGIAFGTVVGSEFILAGRAKVVFRLYLEKPYGSYLLREAALLLLACGECLFVYALANPIAGTILGMACKLALCVVIPTAVNLLLFARTKSFHIILNYIQISLKTVWSELHRKLQ